MKAIHPRKGGRIRARETRRRIVEASYRLMSTKGYAQTTIAEIAAEAEVAVPTVYFSFRGKPALLMEAFRLAIKGKDDIEPFQQDWSVVMQAETDARRALEVMVDASCAILKRVTPLWSIMQGLGDDPEVVEFQRYGEGLRRAGYGRLLEMLALKQPLRPGLSVDDATSVLMVLVGPDVYRTFIEDHGWSDERLVAWMVETVAAALFDDKPPRRDDAPADQLPTQDRAVRDGSE